MHDHHRRAGHDQAEVDSKAMERFGSIRAALDAALDAAGTAAQPALDDAVVPWIAEIASFLAADHAL